MIETKGKIVPERVYFEEENLFNKVYNPDVLLCLANLSNDEVFTPPDVANQMLDMLPQELFEDPNTTFLDPACKSGVFLREIAKRLIKGLENEIPNLEERIDHICKKQLYGIAITELTSLLARRSLYCSKYPNGPFSISSFDNVDGNIRFKLCKHEWDGPIRWNVEKGKQAREWRKCKWCGASEEQFGEEFRIGLETHAYEFIHVLDAREITGNMRFDVIISNPPYQLDDGGNGASAKPIYHLFIEKAKKLKPRYMSMIIPARWYAGGKGLDSFRDTMLNDSCIRELHDFVDASDCFTGVEIKGGVCYFLWDRDNPGTCKVVSHRGNDIVSIKNRNMLEKGNNTFIRYNEAVDILHKITLKNEPTVDKMISPRKPFGLPSNYRDYRKEKLGNSDLYIYAQKDQGYVSKTVIEKNVDWIDKWKVLIPEAIGAGNMMSDIVKPIIAGPGTVCTETYVVAGPFSTKDEAENFVSYVNTRFFHFLLGLKKITQHTTSKTYSFVPQQDFSRPWNDEDLYEKYGLNGEEVLFIEKSVWPEQ